MSDRRLLYLTQYQLTAFRWKLGALSQEGEFLPDAADQSFATYLAEHVGSVFSLVVNLGEEGFHPDVIPYLQAKDRNTVVSRRLGQTFLGAPLSVAISHGYEAGSRKNEKLLLAALTGSAQLDPWLQAIKGAGVRLQGIYSLPLLTEPLLQKLGLKVKRGILVTIQDNTVRQSYLNEGRLAFSRVAPLVGHSISDQSLSIASEANRFQQYLISQRMITASDRLATHILAHPQAIPSIQSGRFNGQLDVTVHDLLAATKKIGLKTARTDNRAQNLYLHLAVSAPPRHQFASPELRQPYRIWQTGNALRAIGALTLAGCLLFSLKLMVDNHNARSDTDNFLRDATAKEQSYQQALGRLPPIPVSNDVLRQLVERVEKIKNVPDTPAVALAHLSQTLDAVPQVEVTDLEWLAPGAKQDAGKRGGAPLPSVNGVAAGTREALIIKGTLAMGAQGSPRQLVATFDDFVRRLGATPAGTTVTVVQTPFDLNASHALKSSDSASTARNTRPFAVQIEFPVKS